MAPDPDPHILDKWDATGPERSDRGRRGEGEPRPLVPTFAATRTDDSEAVRVIFSGELDMGASRAAEAELRRAEQQDRPIVVDLRRLRFIDSTGLKTILDSDRRVQTRGRRLVVIHGSRPVRRVFEIARADSSLEIVDEPPADTALAS